MVGRPRTKICWERAAEMSQAGCTAVEICAEFGCDESTIYDRCKKDLGVTFSEFTQLNRSKGDKLLREAQFNKAIGKSRKGDNTMLLLLGKHRLGQEEKITHVHENIDCVDDITQKDYRKSETAKD